MDVFRQDANGPILQDCHLSLSFAVVLKEVEFADVGQSGKHLHLLRALYSVQHSTVKEPRHVPLSDTRGILLLIEKVLFPEISFGEWLKRRRKGMGLTERQLAARINHSTIMLREVEGKNVVHARGTLTWDLLPKLPFLAETFQTTVTPSRMTSDRWTPTPRFRRKRNHA